MALFRIKIRPKRCLGIDIGTSAIKVIELSLRRERIKLERYGEMTVLALYEKPFRTFEKTSLLLSTRDISRAISAIFKETKIAGKKAVFSIPDFSSFFTSFELPPMTKEEIPQAIKYEARHHIPLPLAEVTLDWSIIKGKIGQKEAPLKVLLVAVPNDIINQYQQIATLANLQLLALETEVFGLVRSLIKEDKKPIVIVDIGGRSTTINIINEGRLVVSHSFDIAGNEFTHVLAKALEVDPKEAEDLKKKCGLRFPGEKEAESLPLIASKIRGILIPLVDLVILEVEKVSLNFFQTEKKKIEKVILAGGSALLPGLKEYFAENLKKEIEIANPFSDILYPPILEETLKKMGPSYAIAVGMALRGLK